MTDKRTLKGIEKINEYIGKEDFKLAINSSKTVINSLILSSYYHIFKTRPLPRPKIAKTEAEKLLLTISKKSELKKIADKKTYKQAIKWFEKFNSYNSNSESIQNKKLAKFALKTFHLINLLNQSNIKMKIYFRKKFKP